MKVVRTIAELRRSLEDRPHGFVPTMGALHGGHVSLLRAARAGSGVVVASIFVNPLQFSPDEDFASYPRDEATDLEVFAGQGVDVAFLPSRDEMYPPEQSTTVNVGRLGEILEGAYRPGHFAGVATICTKLFNLVRPRRAFFGQKDAQQVAVIKHMVADLNFDLEIVVCPTVRDADGLALSSRNAYLSEEQRDHALALYRSIQRGVSVLDARGSEHDAEAAMCSLLEGAPGVTADYAVVRDPDTFEAPVNGKPVLLAVAARVGPARLIDNMLWDPRRAVPERREIGGS